MKNKIIIAALFLLMNTVAAFSQNISGTVYDMNEKNEKNPVPGVTVYWNGTSNATSTDANGKFKISALSLCGNYGFISSVYSGGCSNAV